jgi:hypothetical protein
VTPAGSNAASARSFDDGHEVPRSTVHVYAERLQMRDVHRQAGLSSDVDGFARGIEQADSI